MSFKISRLSVIVLGGINAALCLAPVTAQAYTMADYNAALITVESDQQAIDDLNADIADNQSDISNANIWYPDAITGCSLSGFGNGSQSLSDDAIQDCIIGWQIEWQGVVDDANANISADQDALIGAQFALSTDIDNLNTIKAALGIS